MKSSLRVRKATSSDQKDVIGLFYEFTQAMSRFEPLYKFTKKETQSFIEKKLKDTKSHILVAENDSKELIGFQYAYIMDAPPTMIKHKKIGVIDSVYVKSNARNKGIATSFLKGHVKWLKSKRIKLVDLGVLVKNKKAIAYWESQGFKARYLKMRKKI